MLLKDKSAVVCAATGAIGSAVARRLRAEAAVVHISGRNETSLRQLGTEIGASWDRVDATDEGHVQVYYDRLSAEGSSPDIVFNAVGPRAVEAAGTFGLLQVAFVPRVTIRRQVTDNGGGDGGVNRKRGWR